MYTFCIIFLILIRKLKEEYNTPDTNYSFVAIDNKAFRFESPSYNKSFYENRGMVVDKYFLDKEDIFRHNQEAIADIEDALSKSFKELLIPIFNSIKNCFSKKIKRKRNKIIATGVASINNRKLAEKIFDIFNTLWDKSENYNISPENE